MTVKKKPLVVVTRKLPDSIETRMRELFDARLNLDDTPLTGEQIAEAVRTADVLVPTVTDVITEELLKQPDCKLKLIANFGNGVDNIDVVAAHARGITVTNTPKVLTEDTADLDARPPHRRQAARHHRHGPYRPGSGAPGARLRPANSLPQPPPRCAAHRRRIGRDLLGKPRPDAGADGHHLGELSAHAGHLPSAVGAAPEADPERYLYRQYRARRGDRRRHTGQAAGSRRDRRRRPRRVRERARGQSETGAAGEGRQGHPAAAYGLGHHRGPRRDGRKGDYQHPDLPRQSQAAGSRAAEHAVRPWKPQRCALRSVMTSASPFNGFKGSRL